MPNNRYSPRGRAHSVLGAALGAVVVLTLTGVLRRDWPEACIWQQL